MWGWVGGMDGVEVWSRLHLIINCGAATLCPLAMQYSATVYLTLCTVVTASSGG